MDLFSYLLPLWEPLEDAFLDTVKLLPFLFLTYLFMEYMEHHANTPMEKAMKRTGPLGPVLGAVCGVLPQCGFSAAASNLYAGRIVSMGTLIAIYLSTSDEMLPILISERVSPLLIVKILVGKLVIGMLVGLLVDTVRHFFKCKDELRIGHLCEQEHCHCENGIWRSALRHTLNIVIYIFLLTLLINLLIVWVGEEQLSAFISDKSVIGPVLAGLVGLIPNCAASVVITQLYLKGLLSAGAMMSGLLVGAGVGLLVLFRINRPMKNNFIIAAILYVGGVLPGILLETTGLASFIFQ